MYFVSLLKDGFGFTLSSTITYQNNINGTDVAWALEAMIYEAGLFPTYPNPVFTTGEPPVTSGAATSGSMTSEEVTTGHVSITTGETPDEGTTGETEDSMASEASSIFQFFLTFTLASLLFV